MTVLIPAGLPIRDAARWVGGSCWLELLAHGRITDLLAVPDLADDLRVELWRVRAHRAATSEEWHRRLPELRELPREDFVGPPEELGDPDAGAYGPPSIAAVAGVLGLLDDRYAAHEAVAVGPADGPVRATLSAARARLARDRQALTR